MLEMEEWDSHNLGICTRLLFRVSVFGYSLR